MMADFKVISLNVATSLLSISDVLRNDNPDLLFLQEVSNSTQTLCDRVDTLGYLGECNVDPLHPLLPGTAVVWRKTLKISEVNQLIERRVMSMKCGGETFVNVYAPSGTANRKEQSLSWKTRTRWTARPSPLPGTSRPAMSSCSLLQSVINKHFLLFMHVLKFTNKCFISAKEKNILTGAYDIIAAIDFVNKNKKPAS